METKAKDTSLTVQPQAELSTIEEPGTEQTLQARANQGNNVRSTWRFSMDAVVANISYMSPEAKELLKWAFAWCIDPAHPYRFEEFAARIGMGENTMYKIYNGKYKHPGDKSNPERDRELKNKLMDLSPATLKSLRDFRRLEMSRAKLGRKRFFVTPTAKKIWSLCDNCRKSNTPGILIGASQTGKTEALDQYTINNNHGRTKMIKVVGVHGLNSFLNLLAKSIGVSGKTNIQDLTERIINALTPDMLIIIDEIHPLRNTITKKKFHAIMEAVRRIHDASKASIVFTYTLLNFEEYDREAKRDLEQIDKRHVHTLNIGSAPSKADVKVIMTGYGLVWSDASEEIEVVEGINDRPIDVLKQLAETKGITAISERVRIAFNLAADDSRDEINWHDFLLSHYAILKNAEAPASDWK